MDKRTQKDLRAFLWLKLLPYRLGAIWILLMAILTAVMILAFLAGKIL